MRDFLRFPELFLCRVSLKHCVIIRIILPRVRWPLFRFAAFLFFQNHKPIWVDFASVLDLLSSFLFVFSIGWLPRPVCGSFVCFPAFPFIGSLSVRRKQPKFFPYYFPLVTVAAYRPDIQ